MNQQASQPHSAEVTEITAQRKGKARVKPRHLSRITRQVILDQFIACQSSEDVAEDLGLPVRTVDDVLKLAALRKGPAPASMAFGLARGVA